MKFIYTEALLNLVPNAQFSWQGEEWDGLKWLDSRVCPSKQEWEKEKERLETNNLKYECEEKAKKLLIDSDWSEIPSAVAQLQNVDEWIEYRTNIRKFIINPIDNPIFPTKPKTIWKT